MVATSAIDEIECPDNHGEEGQHLQRTENAAEPLPVVWRADLVLVMAGPQEACKQSQPDDYIKPLLDHLTVDARDLNQQVGEDRSHNQFPYALHPDVNHAPPVNLVEHEIPGVVESEQEKQGRTPKPHEKNRRHC